MEHCRVYIEEEEFIVVSERETAPKNGIGRVVHVAESRGLMFPKPEHKVIRVKRCERKSITQKIRSFIRRNCNKETFIQQR